MNNLLCVVKFNSISGKFDGVKPLYSVLKEEPIKDMWRHNPVPFDYSLNNIAIVHMLREPLSEEKKKKTSGKNQGIGKYIIEILTG